MNRRSSLSRPQPLRPWLLLWLVPFLWSTVDSTIHNPGDCAGNKMCRAHGHGLACAGHNEVDGAEVKEPEAEGAEAGNSEAGLYCIPGKEKAGDGHRHKPDKPGQTTIERPEVSPGDACLECQWMSASTLFLASSVTLQLASIERVVTATRNYLFLSSHAISAFSRGPPVY